MTFQEKWDNLKKLCPICNVNYWNIDSGNICNSILVDCYNCGYQLSFTRKIAISWDGKVNYPVLKDGASKGACSPD